MAAARMARGGRAYSGRVIPQSFDSVDGWRTPSPRLLTLRRLEVVGTALVLAVVGSVIAALGAVVWGLAVLATAAVLGVLVERTLKQRFSAWGYLERADDLLVRRGVLFSRLSVVPYGR